VDEVRVDDAGAEERIRKLAVFLTDLRSFWPLLVPVATGWWRRQFESEGEFGGSPWAPLSPAYEAWKRDNFPGKGILQRTGALKQAASRPTRFVTPHTLTLSIESDYLGFHQDGTSRMPARPLVFGSLLGAEAQAELNAVAEVYIRDLLGRI
jgi:hypothetical protein